MYSLVYGDTVTKKAKGVKQSAIKKQITFHDYKQCLFNDENKYTNFHTIVSKKQELFTVKQTKLSLSAHDDKRHIREDNINTYAHGHYRILLENIKAQKRLNNMDVV
ncbi:hypothetical protein B566_EDAN011076 [Ephemera danica]|nr:hypothetical protein B566_EDAN011076 [Ephemera danica]